MTHDSNYVALRGDVITVASLTDAEQGFVSDLKRQAKQLGEWTVYENYWLRAVADFYKESGLTRKQIRETGVYRIAQDLGVGWLSKRVLRGFLITAMNSTS